MITYLVIYSSHEELNEFQVINIQIFRKWSFFRLTNDVSLDPMRGVLVEPDLDARAVLKVSKISNIEKINDFFENHIP